MRSAGASLDRTPARLHTTVRLKLNQNSMSLTANLATISNRDAWHVVFSFFCRDSLAALAAEPASSTRQIFGTSLLPTLKPFTHLNFLLPLYQHNGCSIVASSHGCILSRSCELSKRSWTRNQLVAAIATRDYASSDSASVPSRSQHRQTSPRIADQITLDHHGRQGLSFLLRPKRARENPFHAHELATLRERVWAISWTPTPARSPPMNGFRELVVSDLASITRGLPSAPFVIDKKLIPI